MKKIDISQWMDTQKEEGVYGVYFSYKRPRISRSEKRNIISFLISKKDDIYVLVINWKPNCKQAIGLLDGSNSL